MKRTVLSLLLVVAASVAGMASPTVAQDAGQLRGPRLRGIYAHGKLRGVTTEEALHQAAAATTIPMWSYAVTASRDDNRYSGVMVGRSPFFHGARTINIPTVIIPVAFTMTDHDTGAAVFDPTSADPTCSPNGPALTLFQNSPLLNAVDFTMPFSGGVDVGSGQYIDAFQRANFWESVSVTGNRYHTTLSPVTTLPVQSVTVPTKHGYGYLSSDLGGGYCGSFGGLDGSWWDPIVFGEGSGGEAQTLISSLTAAGKIGPTAIPIFLFYNVFLNFAGESACNSGCAMGYHNAQGSPVQTYAVADWDTSGTFTGEGETTANSSVLAHELGEWMDDPLGSNLVPSWGHIKQQPGCETNLEVGDPIVGTVVPPVLLNGMDYDLQELAFFSWFYGAPSIAVDSVFSNNGTFSSDAGAVCT